MHCETANPVNIINNMPHCQYFYTVENSSRLLRSEFTHPLYTKHCFIHNQKYLEDLNGITFANQREYFVEFSTRFKIIVQELNVKAII
jgi:hypothetical protein